MQPAEYLIVHEKKVIMKKIFEQATPIKGGYSRLNDDYVARLHRNEVSQPNVDLGRLTNNLYSSTKPVKIEPSYGTQPNSSPKQYTPIYFHKEPFLPSFFRRKDEYSK